MPKGDIIAETIATLPFNTLGREATRLMEKVPKEKRPDFMKAIHDICNETTAKLQAAAVLIAPMSKDQRVAFVKQIHLITRESARKIKEAAGIKK